MMSKIIILVFSLLGLLSACVGQYVQLGQCNPNVELVADFDAEKVRGFVINIAYIKKNVIRQPSEAKWNVSMEILDKTVFLSSQ